MWIFGSTYSDLNAVVGKDQSGVGDSELGGRHFVDGVMLTGLGVLKMKRGRRGGKKCIVKGLSEQGNRPSGVWEKALA